MTFQHVLDNQEDVLQHTRDPTNDEKDWDFWLQWTVVEINSTYSKYIILQTKNADDSIILDHYADKSDHNNIITDYRMLMTDHNIIIIDYILECLWGLSREVYNMIAFGTSGGLNLY